MKFKLHRKKKQEIASQIPFFKRVWLRAKKLITLAGLFALTVICATMPQLVATSYEYSCYARSNGANKLMIAHLTNMISFAYNLAALTTVGLVFLCARAFSHTLRKPNALKIYYQNLDHQTEQNANIVTKGKNKKRGK